MRICLIDFCASCPLPTKTVDGAETDERGRDIDWACFSGEWILKEDLVLELLWSATSKAVYLYSNLLCGLLWDLVVARIEYLPICGYSEIVVK